MLAALRERLAKMIFNRACGEAELSCDLPVGTALNMIKQEDGTGFFRQEIDGLLQETFLLVPVERLFRAR